MDANKVQPIVLNGKEFYAGRRTANIIREQREFRFFLEEADGTSWIVDPVTKRYAAAPSLAFGIQEMADAQLDRVDDGVGRMNLSFTWTCLFYDRERV